MNFRYFIVCAILSCCVSSLFGETWQGLNESTFSVKATGHTVKGAVKGKPFGVTITKNAKGQRMASWKSLVAVADMDTGNEKRDKEMRHTLLAEKHPEIEGEAQNINLDTLMDLDSAPFNFTLAGKTLKINAFIYGVEENEKQLTFHATFSVSQTAHGLTPIRKFMLLKVANQVTAHTHFTFNKPNAQ